jgi:metabotropic glutamate receptor 3
MQISFHWIASDGWGKQQKLVESLEEVAEGAITVELQSEHMPGFDEYMMSLTPENNLRNPWFDEYWQASCLKPCTNAPVQCFNSFKNILLVNKQ